MLSFLQNKILLTVILATVFFIPVFVDRAQAQIAAVVSAPLLEAQTAGIVVATNVSAAVNTTATTWETIRKNGLDWMVYQASQVLLNELTENIIAWIRGGFNGSPSFAVDPERFFNDLADMVAGDFANEIRGIAVCDFDADFRINLMNSLFLEPEQAKVAKKLTCPFDAIDFSSCDSNGQNCRRYSPAEQAQSFAQNFVNGGWNAYEATLRDGGNKFGVALVTKKELNNRKLNQQRIQEQKLTQSGGFLDMIDSNACNYPEGVDVSTLSGSELKTYQRAHCQTTTPGKLIGEQLNKVTGIDMDRLGFADNFNKIASAFIQQVTRMAIQGVYKPADASTGQSPSGLWAAQNSTYDYQSCVAQSEAVVPSEQQQADIAAAVYASAGVQNAQRVFNDADTRYTTAYDLYTTASSTYQSAVQAYNAVLITIPAKRQAVITAQTALNACNAEILCNNQYTLQRNLTDATNIYNIAVDKTASPGAYSLQTNVLLNNGRGGDLTMDMNDKFDLSEAARTEALRIYTQERAPADEALLTALYGRPDANGVRTGGAYANATLAVMGVDMTREGVNCVSNNVGNIITNTSNQTQVLHSDLNAILEQSQANAPIAI